MALTSWPSGDIRPWQAAFNALAEVMPPRWLLENADSDDAYLNRVSKDCWLAIQEIGKVHYLDDTTSPVTNSFCKALGDALSWRNHKLCRRAMLLRDLGGLSSSITGDDDTATINSRQASLRRAVLYTIRRPGVVYEDDRFTSNFCDLEQEATDDSSKDTTQ